MWLAYNFISASILLCISSHCPYCLSLANKDDKLDHFVVLDPEEKYHLSWAFDEEDIVFELQVETLGYVGFGLSPNGDMTGSDIVVGGVQNDDMTTYFTDRHATKKKEPELDEHQDWHLLSGSQNSTHTTLRFRRPLDTCDEEDRRIKWETSRVIWAYHDEDADSTGAVKYHNSMNRGSKSILLLNPQKVVPEIPEGSSTVEFLNSEQRLPAKDTVYWCKAFDIPVLDRKHHVIKIEPVIQRGHESLVHHMLMYACNGGSNLRQTIGQANYCYEPSVMPAEWRNCVSVIFGWAVGGGAFYFPEHVGYPIGFDGDPMVILLQTHYDNPRLRSDFIDSSGFRLTLSPKLRRFDAGTLSIGVLEWNGHVIPPHSESFRTDGHCVPECLTQAMENQTSFSIVAGWLHAHVLGVALRLRHFRSGIEQNVIVEDDNYDFNFQETRTLSHERKVQRGDHLVVECFYKSTGRENVTYGGLSTRNEMCQAYVLYYPRIPLSFCYSSNTLGNLARFANATLSENGTLATPEELKGSSLRVAMEKINWRDHSIRQSFQKYSTESMLRVQCRHDRNTAYPINWKLAPLPETKQTLPEDKGCVSAGSIFHSTPLIFSVYLVVLYSTGGFIVWSA